MKVLYAKYMPSTWHAMFFLQICQYTFTDKRILGRLQEIFHRFDKRMIIIGSEIADFAKKKTLPSTCLIYLLLKGYLTVLQFSQLRLFLCFHCIKPFEWVLISRLFSRNRQMTEIETLTETECIVDVK